MRVRFLVHGRVQGVGYRGHARNHGLILGLSGWVRNEPDGTVRGEAEGDAAVLEAFRGILARGPHTARVVRLEWYETEGGEGLPRPFAVR